MRNPNVRRFKVKTPVFKVSFEVQEQVNIPVESDPFPSFSLGGRRQGSKCFLQAQKARSQRGLPSYSY